MDLLKESTIETIKRMPDGSTVEDIMREINFVAQVLEGLRDAEAGRLISTEELLNRVELDRLQSLFLKSAHHRPLRDLFQKHAPHHDRPS
jgi:predicted transcriptional regulator